MLEYKRYQRPAPTGSLIVRIVEAGGEPFGFLREVTDDGEDDTFPTEQKPVDQVWRLVANKLETNPAAEVFVEMEAGVKWRAAWGKLR